MSEAYVGEIRLFAGTYAPVDWALCDGALLPISQYEALYSLIGTAYGGDGSTTFALPDMRGRVPLHMGNQFTLGQNGGVETVTLALAELPQHGHSFAAIDGPAGTSDPTNALLAVASDNATVYGSDQPYVAYQPSLLSSMGNSQPHDNMQPFLTLSFIMCVNGLYPTQG